MGGLVGGSQEVVIGYKYYLGAHMILCHGPIDAITEIRVAERVAWQGECTGGPISINANDLFGGEEREGGISGTVDVCMGEPTQVANDYLAAKIESPISAFRGVVGMVLRQVYIGLNPYLKPWLFRGRRIMKSTNGQEQWYPSKAAIHVDMNPAHIIRECLTDTNWGMGYSASDIDDTVFMAAADTLYNEWFGLSFLWEREQPIEDFVKDVLRHIDAALFVDRRTGKFKLKLVRDDYGGVDNLPVLDETAIVSVDEYSKPTQGELINSVTVNYWDINTLKISSISAQDIALVQAQGGVNASTLNYAGVTNGTLATKLASRDLRTMSSGAARCVLKCNRKADTLNVGDAFALTWEPLGITKHAMRILDMKLGDSGDGTIEITAVQDVFTLRNSTYAPPPPTEWVDPISQPQVAANRKVMEMPYMQLVRLYGQTEVDDALSADNALGMLVAAAVRPTSDSFNAQLWTNESGAYVKSGNLSFCPSATLSGAITQTQTSITVSGGIYLEDVSIGSWAQIDNELVKVTGRSGNALTIGRGILDTVPAAHASGARIYFWQDYYGTNYVQYASGENFNVKITPTTGKGTLPVASAPADSLSFAARAFRPYPPGQWAISGDYFPTLVEDMPITTTWAHRHRTQQTGADYVTFTSGSIGPEAGTTYSVRLYNNDTNALMHSADDLTGTSYTGFPSPTGRYNLRMELWSVRGGFASTHKQSHVFQYINVTYLNTETLDRLITEDGSFTLTTE